LTGFPRKLINAASLGSRAFFAGGYAEYTVVTTVNIYDAATGLWTVGSPLPAPRGGSGVAVLGSRIFFLGDVGEIVTDVSILSAPLDCGQYLSFLLLLFILLGKDL
jgi:hypothetical protein